MSDYFDEAAGVFLTGNYNENREQEWIEPLGREGFYTEDDAVQHAKWVQTGETENPFLDKAVEEMHIRHYETGEEYGFWNRETQEYDYEVLQQDIWVVEYYGDRANMYEDG